MGERLSTRDIRNCLNCWGLKHGTCESLHEPRATGMSDAKAVEAFRQHVTWEPHSET